MHVCTSTIADSWLLKDGTSISQQRAMPVTRVMKQEAQLSQRNSASATRIVVARVRKGTSANNRTSPILSETRVLELHFLPLIVYHNLIFYSVGLK